MITVTKAQESLVTITNILAIVKDAKDTLDRVSGAEARLKELEVATEKVKKAKEEAIAESLATRAKIAADLETYKKSVEKEKKDVVAELEDSKEEYRKTLENLSTQVSDLKAVIKDRQSTISGLDKEYEGRIAKLEASFQEKLEVLRKEEDAANKRVMDARAQLNALHSKLARMVDL